MKRTMVKDIHKVPGMRAPMRVIRSMVTVPQAHVHPLRHLRPDVLSVMLNVKQGEQHSQATGFGLAMAT
jgi:hypothetical protein